jgi:hypothetical protein
MATYAEFNASLTKNLLDTVDKIAYIDILTDGILEGFKNFDDSYELTSYLSNALTKFARSISFGIDHWKRIVEHKDFNAGFFEVRRFPYFHIDSIEWKKANADKFIALYERKVKLAPNPANSDNKNEVSDSREVDHSREVGTTVDNREVDAYRAEIVGDVILKSYNDMEEQEHKQIKAENNYHSWKLLPAHTYDAVNRPIKLIRIYNHFLVQSEKNKLIDRDEILCMLRDIIARSLISPILCHIIKDKMVCNIIDKLLKQDKKTKTYMIYALQYCFYILRHEETISKNQLRLNNRSIFDLESAHNLPRFNINMLPTEHPSASLQENKSAVHQVHIDSHPYLNLMFGSEHMPFATTTQYCPFYLCGEREIVSTIEFQRRFLLVTNGIFNGIDLEKYNCGITGSILIPCVSVNPLEKRFSSNDENFSLYLDWVKTTKWFINATTNDLPAKDIEFLMYIH